MTMPMLPHEELFQICKKTLGESVWAIEMSADENGKPIWCVYVSDQSVLKKVPDTFRNRPVAAIYCKKPRFAAE